MPLPAPIRRLAALTARNPERAAGSAGRAAAAGPEDGGQRGGEPDSVQGIVDGRAAERGEGRDKAPGAGGAGHGETATGTGPGPGRGTAPGGQAETGETARGGQEEPAGRDLVQEEVEQAEKTGGLGRLGKPMDRRSPFFIGMTAAAGVAVTYAAAELVLRARGILILIGLALFIAAGLDRAVAWLVRRGWPRPVAVAAVLLLCVGAVAGFIGAAIPPLAGQVTALAHNVPQYLHALQNPHSQLGKLNAHYHIQQRLMNLVSSRGTTLVGGVLGAGQFVLSTAESVLLVAVLVVYFLVSFPGIKRFIFRLWPQTRRTRAILIGDEIFNRVGGFLAGNVLTSLIAAAGTYVWMIALGIPYPLLFAILVALLDLIPVIGSTIGGIVVTLVALTVSLAVAIGTLAFYIGYRLAEDYLIVPRVMGQTVQVPAVVTLVATLIGGTLLGIIGALVAIPAAAAIHLLLKEIAFRRLDSS